MFRMSPLFRALCASALLVTALPTFAQALPTPAASATPAAGATSGASQTLPAGAMAVVNGVQIPQSALDSAVQAVISRNQDATDSPKLRKALKEQLIVREVMRQQAVSAHYDQRPEIVQASGTDKTDLVIRAWMQDNVHVPAPTEREIRARYDTTNVELGKFEFKPQVIVVADQKLAQDVISKAKAGQPFDALARDYSMVPSKANGGEMPWVSFRTPVKEGNTHGVPVDFARALAQLKVGAVAPQPVRSGQAWVVVKLEDKRAMKVQPYSEVKEEIRRELTAEAMDAGAAKLVKSLVQSATIIQ
ncbi:MULTISPECIES: peptidyl-prolyl cis-trans isomerase [unclassified Paraburkholderia]|uniref:peptidylprolyl isomerase n=1 Tax=unclassified Paraburkholderia TaxID=2615204 RepID=UPI002AB2CA7D|nr:MULTISPECIES: peptidyl-prolyl cis-trans isomerase [unclassified Paraburkholderia]